MRVRLPSPAPAEVVVPLFDNRPVHPPHLRERAAAMMAAGIPFGEICKSIGLTRGTVAHWFYGERPPATDASSRAVAMSALPTGPPAAR
jgi:hypothetical protein